MQDPSSSSRVSLGSAAIAAAVTLLAALVLWPVVSTGLWADTHEHARYALLFDQFRAAFLRGHAYPRWLPDLYGGFGYPIFCFYPPGFFFAALPFSFLPAKPPYWLYATIWALLSIGAAGAYQLAAEMARRLAGDSNTRVATGLFGAALFLLTPYVWVELFVRGDLAELMGLCLSPWPFVALLRLADRTERRVGSLGSVFVAGASLAAVVFAHPIVGMFVLPTFGLVALSLGEGRTSRELYTRAALALGLGLLLSSVYWYPLATLRSEVGMERATQGYFQAFRHVVYPLQFFSPTWAFGISVPGSGDQMSFQLGLLHFLVASAGFYLGREQRVIRAAYAIYLGLLVCMTPAALLLWRHADLFKLVQFPWRLLSATAALQVLCAAGVAALAARPRMRRSYALSLGSLLVAGFVWHHDQFRIQRPIDLESWVQLQRATGVRSTRLTHAITNEFLPKTAPLRTGLLPRGPSTPILELRPPAPTLSLAGDDEFLIHRRIQAATPTQLTINQLYFPGWRVELDGVSIPESELRRTLDSEGRVTAALAAGNQTLRATYDGPPGWRVRVGAVALGLATFAAFWWRERAAGGHSDAAPTARALGTPGERKP